VRILRYPKPERRGPKAKKPIPRRSLSPKMVKRLFNLQSYRSRVKQANELWRQAIYAKSQSPTKLCLRCGIRPFADAAHCFTKGAYPHLRFDLDNGLPCCRPCHRRIDSDHFAKEQLFRAVLGDARYEALKLRAQSKAKLDMALVLVALQQWSKT